MLFWETGCYNTVRGEYQILMRQEMHNCDEVFDAIWHKNAPLKVSICVWFLLRNRWPTKDNLVRRGIISSDSQLCVSGCGNSETADHLLIHCPTFGELWHHVKTWIGVDLVDPQHIMDHFYQFAYSSGGFKPPTVVFQLIWLCTVYVLWIERNNKLWWLCSWKWSKLLP